MKPNSHYIHRLRRLRRRCEFARDAAGHYQSTAEIEREESERRRAGLAGVATGAGALAAGKIAASKIGALRPDGIQAIRDTLRKLPLRGGRILSGGALASALKNLPR